MHIAFLIKINLCIYNNKISYDTIDTFIELNTENESLETKIMKKYITLDYNIVFNQFTKEKYLIVSNII